MAQKGNIARAAFVLAAVLTSAPALSVPVTWEVNGVVTGAFLGYNAMPFPVAVGDAYSFQFTFDDSAPDLIPANPNFGVYQALLASSVTVGSQTLQLPLNPNPGFSTIAVLDDSFGNEQFSFTHQTTESADPGGFFVNFSLYTSGTAPMAPFNSDALPTTPPDPADFAGTSFALNAFAPDFFLDSFVGNISSIKVVATAVPEPSSLGLAGIGFIALWLVRRRAANTAA